MKLCNLKCVLNSRFERFYRTCGYVSGDCYVLVIFSHVTMVTRVYCGDYQFVLPHAEFQADT